MESVSCPQCKTNKYSNPSLKLLVNICGHSLCENCVEILFIRGSGVCPQCQTVLRRANFRYQLFEDTYVEKEIEIRKRILKDFNKMEEDFNSLGEYNDYLETIENIVFNLANGVNVQETQKMVDDYRRENKEEIKRNRVKMKGEQIYLNQVIENEAAQYAALQNVKEAELNVARQNKQRREALLDDMAAGGSMSMSTLNAPLIHQLATVRMSDLQRRAGEQHEDAPPLVPTPYTLVTYGPIISSHLHSHQLLMKARLPSKYFGGGYTCALACQRLLQDAYCGLFLGSNTA